MMRVLVLGACSTPLRPLVLLHRRKPRSPPERSSLRSIEGLVQSLAPSTTAIRRRDLAIARQLAAAGATPEEAEAYARETATATGRMAPVDLRSFERERLGWRARRRGGSTPLGGLRLVTGQELSD